MTWRSNRPCRRQATRTTGTDWSLPSRHLWPRLCRGSPRSPELGYSITGAILRGAVPIPKAEDPQGGRGRRSSAGRRLHRAPQILPQEGMGGRHDLQDGVACGPATPSPARRSSNPTQPHSSCRTASRPPLIGIGCSISASLMPHTKGKRSHDRRNPSETVENRRPGEVARFPKASFAAARR